MKNGIAQIKSELSLKMNLRVEVIAANTVQGSRWLLCADSASQTLWHLCIYNIYMEDP